jgi:hypothetical protein
VLVAQDGLDQTRRRGTDAEVGRALALDDRVGGVHGLVGDPGLDLVVPLLPGDAGVLLDAQTADVHGRPAQHLGVAVLAVDVAVHVVVADVQVRPTSWRNLAVSSTVPVPITVPGLAPAA